MSSIYGPFAIEKGETAKKIFFELIVILDIFQPKNHICHININFIFLAVSPFFIAKSPYVAPYIEDALMSYATPDEQPAIPTRLTSYVCWLFIYLYHC